MPLRGASTQEFLDLMAKQVHYVTGSHRGVHEVFFAMSPQDTLLQTADNCYTRVSVPASLLWTLPGV